MQRRSTLPKSFSFSTRSDCGTSSSFNLNHFIFSILSLSLALFPPGSHLLYITHSSIHPSILPPFILSSKGKIIHWFWRFLSFSSLTVATDSRKSGFSVQHQVERRRRGGAGFFRSLPVILHSTRELQQAEQLALNNVLIAVMDIWDDSSVLSQSGCFFTPTSNEQKVKQNKKRRLGMSRELQQLVFERSRNVNVNVSVGDKAENCDPGHWTVKASSLNNRGRLSQIHSVLSFHSRQQGSTFCPSASSLAHDRQEVNEDFFFFFSPLLVEYSVRSLEEQQL